MKKNFSNLHFSSKVANFTENYWTEICSGLGTILFGVAGVLTGLELENIFERIPGRLMIAAIILSLLGMIFSVRKSSNLRQLQEENNTYKDELKRTIITLKKSQKGYSQSLYHNILTLSEALDFNASERISVYKYDGRTKYFNLLSRHSKNPQYKKKGRAIYPDNQGCISRAFQKRFYCRDKLPEFDTQEYLEIMKCDYNLPKNKTRKLTMPTRSFAAFAIVSKYDEAIGVVVFESTEPEGLDNEKIRKIMYLSELKRIAYLLGTIEDKEPTLSMAQNEGY